MSAPTSSFLTLRAELVSYLQRPSQVTHENVARFAEVVREFINQAFKPTPQTYTSIISIRAFQNFFHSWLTDSALLKIVEFAGPRIFDLGCGRGFNVWQFEALLKRYPRLEIKLEALEVDYERLLDSDGTLLHPEIQQRTAQEEQDLSGTASVPEFPYSETRDSLLNPCIKFPFPSSISCRPPLPSLCKTPIQRLPTDKAIQDLVGRKAKEGQTLFCSFPYPNGSFPRNIQAFYEAGGKRMVIVGGLEGGCTDYVGDADYIGADSEETPVPPFPLWRYVKELYWNENSFQSGIMVNAGVHFYERIDYPAELSAADSAAASPTTTRGPQ